MTPAERIDRNIDTLLQQSMRNSGQFAEGATTALSFALAMVEQEMRRDGGHRGQPPDSAEDGKLLYALPGPRLSDLWPPLP